MAIRSVALAGMVADTSLYNIDGACVVGGTDPINVGVAVSVTEDPAIDGHKVVSAVNKEGSAYGVVVRSHYETPDGTAKAKEAVNVMTAGRIWMKAAAAITAANRAVGKPVFVNAAGLVVNEAAARAAAFTTGWTFAGGYIANTGSDPQNLSVDGALVEVQVKQK